ncbi:hypothetical protein BJX68DRAFT_230907 [Aspergillus pseudodeflectus]|uniref:DUF7730 domain-containing protein n=1 Tax=Aspergillus pseudodeflectus TaxID=176178 RepID=A0ABR4KTJ9_9EURO
MPQKRKQTEIMHKNPSSTRRPLTPPLDPPAKRSTRNTSTPTTHPHPQTQSPFFHLPREIRDIAYHEIFVFNETIHIAYVGGRTHKFRSALCRLPERDQLEQTRSGELCWQCREVCNHSECSPRNPWNKVNLRGNPALARKLGVKVIGMLSTCRRVYIETIHLLYARNRFYIGNPPTVLELPRYIPQSRLSAIRTLYLESPVYTDAVSHHHDPIPEWERIVKALEKFDGLTDLCIILRPLYGFASDVEALKKPVRDAKLVVEPRFIVKKVVDTVPANRVAEDEVCGPGCAMNRGVRLGLHGTGSA